jgi:hypothetical protein
VTRIENPSVKVGHPLRLRRDRADDIAAAADRPGRDRQQFIRYGVDLMLGSIRCGRCDEEVPIILGDIRGKEMWEWMEAAQKAIHGQHPGVEHNPVLVGAEAASQPPPSSGTAGEAARKEGDAGEHTEPPAPDPAVSWHGKRVSEMTDAEVQAMAGVKPARSRKAGGFPVAAESAPAATGPAAVFRSFDPADEPFTPPAVPVPAVPASRTKKGRAKCTHIVSAGTRCKICEPRGNS